MSLCAICDDTNETTRLCAPCRADPVNADWRGTPSREVLGAESDAGSNERTRSRAVLQDCQARPLRKPTMLQQRILDLLVRGVAESYGYRDRRKRRRGTRQRWRAARVTEVARMVGCHRKYVERVRKAFLHAAMHKLAW